MWQSGNKIYLFKKFKNIPELTHPYECSFLQGSHVGRLYHYPNDAAIAQSTFGIIFRTFVILF